MKKPKLDLTPTTTEDLRLALMETIASFPRLTFSETFGVLSLIQHDLYDQLKARSKQHIS